jgi:hypothetical protein
MTFSIAVLIIKGLFVTLAKAALVLNVILHQVIFTVMVNVIMLIVVFY